MKEEKNAAIPNFRPAAEWKARKAARRRRSATPTSFADVEEIIDRFKEKQKRHRVPQRSERGDGYARERHPQRRHLCAGRRHGDAAKRYVYVCARRDQSEIIHFASFYTVPMGTDANNTLNQEKRQVEKPAFSLFSQKNARLRICAVGHTLLCQI